MKEFFSLSRLVLLFISTLSMVWGINVDNALQYRQQTVPIGTGPTTSSAAQTPSSSTASTSGAVSIAPPLSTADPLTPSASSTVISEETTSQASNVITASAAAPQSQPTSSRATSGTNSRTQPSVVPSSSTTTSSSIGKSSAGSATTTPKPATSRTQQIITTVTIVSEGITQTNVVTTSGRVAVSDPVSTHSVSPTLPANNGGSNNSGLEPSQKRVIIGVVVGIGGAILFGGFGVVAWRISGKRKRSADEDHELMDSQPGSSGREKRSSVSGNSPFRSTLDQYHNPAGPVNTASNF